MAHYSEVCYDKVELYTKLSEYSSAKLGSTSIL